MYSIFRMMILMLVCLLLWRPVLSPPPVLLPSVSPIIILPPLSPWHVIIMPCLTCACGPQVLLETQYADGVKYEAYTFSSIWKVLKCDKVHTIVFCCSFSVLWTCCRPLPPVEICTYSRKSRRHHYSGRGPGAAVILDWSVPVPSWSEVQRWASLWLVHVPCSVFPPPSHSNSAQLSKLLQDHPQLILVEGRNIYKLI